MVRHDPPSTALDALTGRKPRTRQQKDKTMSKIKNITTHVYTYMNLEPGSYLGVQSAYIVTIPLPGSTGEVEIDDEGIVTRGPCLDIELEEGIRGTRPVKITIDAGGKCTVESPDAVSAESDTYTTGDWHAALDWYRATARNLRAGGRTQDAAGIDRICDAGAAGVSSSQRYIVDRWRERDDGTVRS